MDRYCSKCGAPIQPHQVKCMKCGVPIDGIIIPTGKKNREDYDQTTSYDIKVIIGLILGILTILAWLIPVIGYPLTLIALLLNGYCFLYEDSKTISLACGILSIICLILTIINSIIHIV